MIRHLLLISFSSLGLIAGLPPIAHAAPHPVTPITQAETAIRDVYYAKVDRSIKLRGVTIVQNWALAHWQGQHDGGMVIFQQGKTGWKILRGTGGSFTYQDLVSRFAIPPALATALIEQGAPELRDTLPIQVGHKRR
jgi:hypothetical protein